MQFDFFHNWISRLGIPGLLSIVLITCIFFSRDKILRFFAGGARAIAPRFWTRTPTWLACGVLFRAHHFGLRSIEYLMASQVETGSELQVLEISSYIRGFHAYRTPLVGETLRLRREPTDSVDKHVVAVIKDGAVVWHVPYNLAPRFSQFLMRNVNKAFA